MHESEELCVEASPCIHFANSFCQMWHGCAQFLKSLTHASLSSFDTVFWPQSMLSLWSVCEVQISRLDWIVCLFEVEVLYTIYYMLMKVTCPYWEFGVYLKEVALVPFCCDKTQQPRQLIERRVC